VALDSGVALILVMFLMKGVNAADTVFQPVSDGCKVSLKGTLMLPSDN
jgi:hypothetical protein